MEGCIRRRDGKGEPRVAAPPAVGRWGVGGGVGASVGAGVECGVGAGEAEARSGSGGGGEEGGSLFDWEEPWRGRRPEMGKGRRKSRGRRPASVRGWFEFARDDERSGLGCGAIGSVQFAAVTSPRVYYSTTPGAAVVAGKAVHRQSIIYKIIKLKKKERNQHRHCLLPPKNPKFFKILRHIESLDICMEY